MSSPEAPSNQPRPPQPRESQPSLEEYLADGGSYAYGAEAEDGDASPELTPMDPETEAHYDDAREAIHNAEGPIRHMYQEEIDRAMSDIRTHRQAEAKAKPALDANKEKSDKIEAKIAERQKIVDDLRTELAAQNRVGKKYKTSTNRLRWHEEKLRNLRSEKQGRVFEKEEIDDKITRAMPNDESRRNESYQNLRGGLLKIDDEIKRRHDIQVKLEDPSTDDKTRQTLQQEVDRWPRNDDGEIETDEQLRERLTREAGDAYGESLASQADREKTLRFEDAYEQITEKHLQNASLIDNGRADPVERQEAIAELTKIDETRNSLIDESEMDEFKIWIQEKAEEEKAEEEEALEYKDELVVAESRAKKAEAEEESALDAINDLAENIKKLSSRGDVLSEQLLKLSAQSDEIQKNLGPVTDPVVRTQLQEAFNRVEKEMTAVVTEQNDVKEKIDQAASSQPALEEAHAQKKADAEAAIESAATLRNKLNEKITRSYFNKLRVAGL